MISRLALVALSFWYAPSIRAQSPADLITEGQLPVFQIVTQLPAASYDVRIRFNTPTVEEEQEEDESEPLTTGLADFSIHVIVPNTVDPHLGVNVVRHCPNEEYAVSVNEDGQVEIVFPAYSVSSTIDEDTGEEVAIIPCTVQFINELNHQFQLGGTKGRVIGEDYVTLIYILAAAPLLQTRIVQEVNIPFVGLDPAR